VIQVSGRHQRGTPLDRLLARLGWQREPEGWTVPCRDHEGHRARLLIRLAPSEIIITPSAPGPLRLTVPQAGRLRGVTRSAIYTCGLGAGSGHAEDSGAPREGPSLPRQVIHILPAAAARPTVGELCALNPEAVKHSPRVPAAGYGAGRKTTNWWTTPALGVLSTFPVDR
jgi:hypothetical protein